MEISSELWTNVLGAAGTVLAAVLVTLAGQGRAWLASNVHEPRLRAAALDLTSAVETVVSLEGSQLRSRMREAGADGKITRAELETIASDTAKSARRKLTKETKDFVGRQLEGDDGLDELLADKILAGLMRRVDIADLASPEEPAK